MADAATLRDVCTAKEAAFAEARAAGSSLAEAARAAGYAGDVSQLARTGRRVAARERVQAYLAALRDEATGGETKSELEQVLARLKHIGMGGNIQRPVGRGSKLKSLPAPVSAQIDALKTLARALGGLDPRVRVDIGPSVRAELEAIRRRVSPEVFRQVLEAVAALHGHGEDDD